MGRHVAAGEDHHEEDGDDEDGHDDDGDDVVAEAVQRSFVWII